MLILKECRAVHALLNKHSDPCIGQYEYTANAVPAVPFVQKNAQMFNFNDTFMADLAFAHEFCGYANYTQTYLQFPPIAAQPPIDYGFNNISFTTLQNKTINCDVWNQIYDAAYLTNPCFNVYEISSMCPILSDPLGYPSDLQYQYPGMGGVYFNRTDVKKAMHAPMDVDWSEVCYKCALFWFSKINGMIRDC
jgi:carboxypeptidase D